MSSVARGTARSSILWSDSRVSWPDYRTRFAQAFQVNPDAINAAAVGARGQDGIARYQSEPRNSSPKRPIWGQENVRNFRRSRCQAPIVGHFVVIQRVDNIDVSRRFAALVAQAVPDAGRHDDHHGSNGSNSHDFSSAFSSGAVSTIPERELDVAADGDKMIDLLGVSMPNA